MPAGSRTAKLSVGSWVATRLGDGTGAQTGDAHWTQHPLTGSYVTMMCGAAVMTYPAPFNARRCPQCLAAAGTHPR